MPLSGHMRTLAGWAFSTRAQNPVLSSLAMPSRSLSRFLLTLVLLLAAPLAEAAGQQPRITTPVPGAPGTATPTPYPQITPSAPPKAYDNHPGGPLLPPMPLPRSCATA